MNLFMPIPVCRGKLYNMKYFVSSLLCITLFASCKNNNHPVVSAVFADSLMLNYTIPAAIKTNEADLQFWKNRIQPDFSDYINSTRYAATLISRFHLLTPCHLQ